MQNKHFIKNFSFSPSCFAFLFLFSGLLIAAGLIPSQVFAADAKRVLFVEPKDGAEVHSPVKVVMDVSGMKVAVAGEVKPNEGHHHLIVDGDPIAEGAVVPADATHIHFGKAQTETTVELSPGKHSLTLQFADGAHRSYGPSMSETITVNVK